MRIAVRFGLLKSSGLLRSGLDARGIPRCSDRAAADTRPLKAVGDDAMPKIQLALDKAERISHSESHSANLRSQIRIDMAI